MNRALLDAALGLHDAALCVLPAATDGSKRPGVPAWRQYQATRPARTQVEAWFTAGQQGGLGVVCGAVSGQLEMLELEGRAVAEGYAVRISERAEKAGLGGLWARINCGYRETTPSGGWHLLYRVDGQVAANTKLAGRAAADNELTQEERSALAAKSGKTFTRVLIETRGEGGWVVTAPSHGPCHPTGGAWRIVEGRPDTIPTITADERDALHDLMRSFDQTPTRPMAAQPRAPTSPAPHASGSAPGDDYNRRVTWEDVLEPHGWRKAFRHGRETHWRRPGKTMGTSATTGHTDADCLHVFTTSTEFESETSYTKFGAHTVLEHGGDYAAAARALLGQGYGRRPPASRTRPAARFDERPADGPPDDVPSRVLRLVPASTIKPRPVRWAWADRLAVGTLALIPGRVGIGKSLLLVWVAAMLTRGRLPGVHHGTPKPVIMLATEDSWEHTIVPRLIVAGADLGLVYRADVIVEDSSYGRLTLPRDCVMLGDEIKRIGAAMVGADPLISLIDGALDTHKNRDVRDALEPLIRTAGHTGCAVVGLAHHNKSAGADPLGLITGSAAFSEVVRAVISVARDPEDDYGSVIASQTKNNLGRVDLPSYRYVIDSVALDTDEGPASTGRLRWVGESDRSVFDILESGASDPGDKGALRDAAEWLREYLETEGPSRIGDIRKHARANGHSDRTLDRAKQRLRVVAQRHGGLGRAGHWEWQLPVDNLRTPKSSLSQKVGVLNALSENLAPLAHGESPDDGDYSPSPKSAGDMAPLDDALSTKSVKIEEEEEAGQGLRTPKSANVSESPRARAREDGYSPEAAAVCESCGWPTDSDEHTDTCEVDWP